MARKKIIIAAIVSAAVIMAGGGGVYAYNYHQEQVEQEKQKQIEEEEREKERLKQEEEKRLREEEEKRLQDARAEIEKELEGINTEVATLYSDDQKKMPADGITQDQIDPVLANIESFKEKYKENKDITKEQNGDLQEMEKEVRFVNLMNEVVTKHNSLYPNGQLVAPKTETDETVTTLKDKLKELEGNKPDFFQTYSEKLSEAESSFAFQRSVLEAVNMIYKKEAGSMIAGVTRQQYNDVLAAVETMPDNELKAELRQYLTVVDQTLTAQEEAVKTQKASSGNNSGNGSSSSGSSSSNGNSGGGNISSGSGSSGSKRSSGNGSSGRGNSSSGSSSSGNSSVSNGNSGGGNSSSGSGSSGSGNSSAGNGSSEGGNSSSGNNDSDGYGSWEGTITGGGETKGGGTWESFEW